MLGRLKMDIDSCIKAYITLADVVFQKVKHRVKTYKGEVQGRFDTEALERSIKEIIVGQGLEADALLKDDANAQCKVSV